MLSEKVVGFLKRWVYNARTDWHKIGFNFLVDCKNILDVGCGKGLFIGLAPDKIVGLDWNWRSLKECVNKGYTVISRNTLNLPFAGKIQYVATNLKNIEDNSRNTRVKNNPVKYKICHCA
jgi:SAM-dependent methyltransferase